MLLVRETLTAFVTEQNRSQWFSTDTYTSCIITPMLMLKSTVCVRVDGFSPARLSGGHRNFPLMHLATFKKEG